MLQGLAMTAWESEQCQTVSARAGTSHLKRVPKLRDAPVAGNHSRRELLGVIASIPESVMTQLVRCRRRTCKHDMASQEHSDTNCDPRAVLSSSVCKLQAAEGGGSDAQVRRHTAQA